MTRMATAAIIRENLAKAQEYQDKLSKAEEDPDEDVPDYDAKLEALAPVATGALPAHFHAHRADDIATAVRISGEFGLKLVVVHGTEGYLVPELLAQANVPVITGPCLTDRSKPELVGQTLSNPARLRAAGVKVAICTDHPETPIQYLPLCAAMAVRGGMEPEDALAAITRTPPRSPASPSGWAPSPPARTPTWWSPAATPSTGTGRSGPCSSAEAGQIG